MFLLRRFQSDGCVPPFSGRLCRCMADGGECAPMKKTRVMNYCSRCGAPVTLKRLEPELRERMICTRCGCVHFENPKILVLCLAHCHDRLLMCRRRHEPAAGKWLLPGGFVETGETLELATAREVAEETGVIVDPNRLIPYSIANLPHLCEVYISFRVEISPPKLMAGAESLEVALFAEDDMPWDGVAYEPHSFYRAFFHELRSGRFSLHLSEHNPESHTRRSFPMAQEHNSG
jgi:ADP-ribose pyrophosphatase YjhB (NUDIX family)